MNLKSKKTSLLILCITSILCSRAMFLFFNDPEGPNLLVILGAAAVIYLLSLGVYLFSPLIKGQKKFWLTVLAQIIIVAVLYLLLK